LSSKTAIVTALDAQLKSGEQASRPSAARSGATRTALVGKNDFPHPRVAALAGAENVVELALFEPGDDQQQASKLAPRDVARRRLLLTLSLLMRYSD
jgi:hypothetical protein